MNIFLVKRLSFFLIISAFFSSSQCFADIARDLELDTIVASLNHTRTAEGKKALQTLLTNPIADVQLLHQRQRAIAYLFDNDQVHKHIITALENFAQHELSFNNACAVQTSSVANNIFKNFYFSSKRFKIWNENPIALEFGQLGHIANLVSSSVQHLLTMVVFNWGLGEKDACCDHKGHKHKDKKHGHHNHDHHHAKNNTIAYMRQFLMAWHGIAQIQECYSIYTIIRNDMNTIKALQEQLMMVARGIRTIKQVHTIVQEHPNFTEHLSLYKKLDAICLQIDVSKKLNLLLTLLESCTFQGNSSVFSRVGNILAAYKLLQEVSQELQPALQAIGEIDVYSSCAQLLQEYKTGPLRYTFAQYVTNQATPYVETDNFWHPLISSTKVIVNSIVLGNNNHTGNILLTGSNASGKSTSLKSLTLCVYLAQTLSIVPAERHTQTLFKEIYSSIVIVDQLQQGKSLFITELENAQYVLKRVEKLAPGEYIFVALDELFKSTQHEKGQKVAEQFLKALYASPNVITITTTHFEKLIDFALKNSSVCTNYTVRDFKLVPGIGKCDYRDVDRYFC